MTGTKTITKISTKTNTKTGIKTGVKTEIATKTKADTEMTAMTKVEVGLKKNIAHMMIENMIVLSQNLKDCTKHYHQ